MMEMSCHIFCSTYTLRLHTFTKYIYCKMSSGKQRILARVGLRGRFQAPMYSYSWVQIPQNAVLVEKNLRRNSTIFLLSFLCTPHHVLGKTRSVPTYLSTAVQSAFAKREETISYESVCLHHSCMLCYKQCIAYFFYSILLLLFIVITSCNLHFSSYLRKI